MKRPLGLFVALYWLRNLAKLYFYLILIQGPYQLKYRLDAAVPHFYRNQWSRLCRFYLLQIVRVGLKFREKLLYN